jgi:hypothetical protein
MHDPILFIHCQWPGDDDTKNKRKIEGKKELVQTVVCHCVQCGARAAAISFPWRDVLRPYAPFAWLALGRDMADLALEGDQVDEEEGNVPAKPAEK